MPLPAPFQLNTRRWDPKYPKGPTPYGRSLARGSPETEFAGDRGLRRRYFPPTFRLPSFYPSMSTIGNVSPASPTSDFKLRHWRSPPVPRPPFLRRKDAAVPAELSLLPYANRDLQLNDWNPEPFIRDGYTSIRDLLLSSPRSCAASPTAAGCDIQIRHPLVKQAVYSYLQLTPSGTESSSSSNRNRPLRRFIAAICAAFRPLRRCFGIFRRLLCCAGAVVR